MIKLDLSNYTESTWDEYILSLAKDPEFKDDIEFSVPDVITLVSALQKLSSSIAPYTAAGAEVNVFRACPRSSCPCSPLPVIPP